jgi:hypothetical protein
MIKNLKYKSPFKKFIITPEQTRLQKRIFNVNKFGSLKFYFVISHRKTNTFFSFYCKASKIPSKVFLFCKYSTGSELRDAIRDGKAPVVPLRGRCKNQLQRIRFKFNQLKSYVYEFIRIHPEMIKYNSNFNVIWKIYKLDMNIHSLITQPFNILVSSKNKDQIELRTPLNIIHDFILKFPHNGCRPKKMRRLKKKRK